MEKSFQKFAGYSLILSAVLMTLTMVLHPSGGDIEHILKMAKVAIIAHSLAIFCLPFVAYGFYGLTLTLQTPSKISLLGFMFCCFALLAGMIAATINGLTLPFFVIKFPNETGQNLEAMKLIINYGSFINKPMDYIFIGGLTLAIGIWSVLIIQHNVFSKWLGYFGIILVFLAAIAILFNFNFTNLFGFRIYVFSMVSWIVSAGWLMIKNDFLRASV